MTHPRFIGRYMSKKNAKTEKILDESINLLKNEGDFGLTMRKVSRLTEMSLSNLQYHYKNKDELLKAMADRYFQQCLSALEAQPAIEQTEHLYPFLIKHLVDGFEMSDMCRIFREYWAISTRNGVIEAHVQQYYKDMVVVIEKKLAPLSKDNKSLIEATSLLISFVEGYSITAKSLSMDLESMAMTIEQVILTSLGTV